MRSGAKWLRTHPLPRGGTDPAQQSLLTADRHVSHDFSARVIIALDRQSPANLLRALAHADQSEMAVSSIYLMIKPTTVISYDELHSLRIEDQIDEYPLRLRVFDCIVYRLLPDAEKIALD